MSGQTTGEADRSDVRRGDGLRPRRTPLGALLVVVAMIVGGLAVVTAAGALEAENEDCPFSIGGYGGYGYGGDCADITDATLAVDPATDLVDRQVVTVTGTDFDPVLRFVTIYQCPAAELEDGAPLWQVCYYLPQQQGSYIDGEGSFEVEQPVLRVLPYYGDEVDCALVDCVLAVETTHTNGLPVERATAAIDFDPEVPPVPPLTIDLEIVDADLASVAGTLTCNREAEVYLSARVTQDKKDRFAGLYGYDTATDCSAEPVEVTVPLTQGQGTVTGGPALASLSGYVYDEFDFAEAYVEQEVTLNGRRQSPIPTSVDGQFIEVEILGLLGRGDERQLEVEITCAEAVDPVNVFVELQDRNDPNNYVYGSQLLSSCDGAQRVGVPLVWGNGVFVGDEAVARVEANGLVDTDPFPLFDFATAYDTVRVTGRLSLVALEANPDPDSRITIGEVTTESVRGTVVCDGADHVYLSMSVTQLKGVDVNVGRGWEQFECDDDVVAFDVPFQPYYHDVSPLRPGEAVVDVYADGYAEGDPFWSYVWFDNQSESVRVRAR